MAKLFSSVPKREYAIDHVSLELHGGGWESMTACDMDDKMTNPNGHDKNDSSTEAMNESRFYSSKKNYGNENNIHDTPEKGLTLLVGRSSSGKTTLLRLLAGCETPTSGDIQIECINRDQQSPPATSSVSKVPSHSQIFPTDITDVVRLTSGVTPVIIDRKPDCYDDTCTVFERILLHADVHSKSQSTSQQETTIFITQLAYTFAFTMGLSEAQIHEKPSNLSPSGQYMFGITCACMESIRPWLKEILSQISKGTKSWNDCVVGLPYPILFLDELFDFEHPDVPNKVAKGMSDLCRKGAIVLLSTHKPHPLLKWSSRMITMSAGKILLDELL